MAASTVTLLLNELNSFVVLFQNIYILGICYYLQMMSFIPTVLYFESFAEVNINTAHSVTFSGNIRFYF